MIEKIQFSIDEVNAFNFRDDQTGKSISWDASKEVDKEIEFSACQLEMIVNAIKTLDSSKEVNDELVPLCETFLKEAGINLKQFK